MTNSLMEVLINSNKWTHKAIFKNNNESTPWYLMSLTTRMEGTIEKENAYGFVFIVNTY